jgi:hypothetical protein
MLESTGATPSAPLFSPHAEAKAMEALNILIVVRGGDASAIRPAQVEQLRVSVTRLVDCLFPIKGDSAEFAGADVLEGTDYVHPIKVAELAATMGRVLGRPRSALISLAMAAALMNVGYLTLRRSLLDEPRRLLDGEWEQHVHTHPNQGVALLTGSGLPDDCLRAIGEHHERWDGSGYPGGVRGEAIAREARILAIADSYVSLRSARPYRHAVDADEARQEIASEGGRLFDPQMVGAFEEVMARYAASDRTEPTSKAGVQLSPDARVDGRGAQRNGSDRTDDDAGKPAREGADDADASTEHSHTSRPGAPAAERARALPGSAPGGTAWPPRGAPTNSSGLAAAAPAHGAPLTAALRTGAQAPARRRRQRRRGRTLFCADFYVAGAVRGGWAADLTGSSYGSSAAPAGRRTGAVPTAHTAGEKTQ